MGTFGRAWRFQRGTCLLRGALKAAPKNLSMRCARNPLPQLPERPVCFGRSRQVVDNVWGRSSGWVVVMIPVRS